MIRLVRRAIYIHGMHLRLRGLELENKINVIQQLRADVISNVMNTDWWL